MTGETHYEYERLSSGNVAVHAVHHCHPRGQQKFHNVAAIVEPESENPGLMIPRPLGVDAVLDICRRVTDREYL